VRSARSALAELAARDALLLAAQLSLLALLLAPIGTRELRACVLALAALGLVAPAAARSAALWLALAALAALRVALDWPMSDNHAYLLCTWCLALAVALAGPAPGASLASNARLLVGLAFALATFQKAWARDYLDGTFFRWALAIDPRFEALGTLLGRSAEDLARTRALLRPWRPAPPDAAFVETAPLFVAAQVLTFATLLLECAVALAFLSPLRRMPALVRDASLLVFCVATYAVAPVSGFGWVLLAMGVAQVDPARAGTRRLYLAAFALLIAYRDVPWAAWLSEAARIATR
jgi:hypothetical protein